MRAAALEVLSRCWVDFVMDEVEEISECEGSFEEITPWFQVEDSLLGIQRGL